MSEAHFYDLLLRGFGATALITFPILFFITAPYGRHVGKASSGVMLDSTLCWVVMEAPSAIVFALCYLLGDRPADGAQIAFLLLWEAHYVHRAFIFPFRRRGGQPKMALHVAASSFAFTSINGYLNGRVLFSSALAPAHLTSGHWTSDPRFLAGTALFVLGFAVNQWADRVLFNLRRPGEKGYKIPRGGLYELISCPNYFGEIVEWSGFALLTWSPAALVFALWTAANLLPRARAHHRWYKEQFADYPPARRAAIPFLF